MTHKDITSLRSTIEWLKEQDEVLLVEGEVDPIYEIAGIQKALDNGPALLFENIKGYPNARNIGNLFSTQERVAKIFDVADPRNVKFKCLEAKRNPMPAEVVDGAPCQELVITEDIDVMGTLPIVKHTEQDAGRMLGGGLTLLTGRYFKGGSHIGFNRMNFRGRDWASINATRGTHLGDMLWEFKGQKVPVTYNIGAPPAAMLATGPSLHTRLPVGSDYLGIAGGIQGSPIELVKARTVDAYALAQSEWVLEGYIDTTERIWETEEAEKTEEYGKAPFFPEWPGYMGRAIKSGKFQVTAITHRQDQPVFHTPLAHSLEAHTMYSRLREALFYELMEQLIPGLVVDVNILWALTHGCGLVYQVRKRHRGDEGWPKNIIAATFGTALGMYMVIVVDEDVDIYSADDVLWAITSRCDPDRDISRGPIGGVGSPMTPLGKERSNGGKTGVFRYPGGLGIDATMPFDSKWAFERAKYPVDRIDLSKWFSLEQIQGVRAIQNDYAKILAKTGG